ncbi:MAG: V-type ATP synthase subunit K [Kiritimatiellae bacterium]|nr:V-type ATP synthase subunit K [Kiritimatiellia bacterium]
MTPEQINAAIGIAGAVACLGLSALGSALGTGSAALAAVGAWKKCYAQGKPAPFILLGLVGAPITQTLYGMVLMFIMFGKAAAGWPMLVLGIFAGIGIGSSAFFQGKAAAAACDAQAETGQGLVNYFGALGIVETVAIFTMVLSLLAVFKIGA